MPRMRLGAVRWMGLALWTACSSGGPSAPATPAGDGGLDGGNGALGDGGAGGDARTQSDDEACVGVVCPEGLICQATGATVECVTATCEQLNCVAPATCQPAASGTGFFCDDPSCSEDGDCEFEEFCGDDGLCAADTCEPGASRCAGNAVERCADNGSAFVEQGVCGSAGMFSSACTEMGGEAFCPCEADWDCPQFTQCNVDRCVGESAPPTCTLDPTPFSEALPTPEYGVTGAHWGGESNGQPVAAEGTPFRQSTQVVMTPVIANLTDDNGDGFVNELDFPEIVFLSFCNAADFRDNGILRAIHGGGPDKGLDLFASCGQDKLWKQGDPTSGDEAINCACGSDPVLDSTASLAVGDLDGDGFPEIVAVTEDNALHLYDRTGEFIAESPVIEGGGNGAPALANLDGEGLAEIVLGRTVVTLAQQDNGNGGLELTFDRTFVGNAGNGQNGQGPISCIADLDDDGRQEVIAGATAYRFVAPAADCNNPVDSDEQAFCDGTLPQLWDEGGNGFCAIADVWGADPVARPGPANPLDGTPEVILVQSGDAKVYRGLDGMLLFDQQLGDGDGNGGAPNVDDFDGDGYPEVGTATKTGYTMVDLQAEVPDACPAWTTIWPSREFDETMEPANPNGVRTPPAVACTSDADCDPAGTTYACNEATSQCVCLHNSWTRGTQDDSSHVTGSSLFDFNGDGSVEVVYNDECFFRVYAGLDGQELFREPSESRTRIENPAIADVDNDGNAEIIFTTSTESGFCSSRGGGVYASPERDVYNPGVEVWGDANDRWVSARRIYNQHAYHVTNVTEGGGIPTVEPPGWLPLNGRLYNSYRSQPRSSAEIAAPDLTIVSLQVTSPNGCEAVQDDAQIVITVRNEGDLRVGPGVRIGLHGEWTDPAVDEPLLDEAGDPLAAELDTSLEPGAEISVTVPYRRADSPQGTLPDSIEAVVDEGNSQRECDEDNNRRKRSLSEAGSGADLTVDLTGPMGLCPNVAFEATVTNQGNEDAEGVVVRIYIGDPAAGGIALTSATFPDPIPAGESNALTFVIPDFPSREVVVVAVVDPDDRVAECNDGNNDARVPTDCTIFIQ